MKKLSLGILLFIITVFIAGCGSSQPTVPKVKVTEKFKVDSISLILNERVKSDIVYHTQSELEQLLTDSIIKALTEKGLISSDTTMNKLKIDVFYKRRFVGDATPLPSDSLAYPFADYKINVMDGTKLLTKINRENLTYKGGFIMNMQVIAGTLRDKKYELEFIQAVANKIIDDITKL